MTDALKGRTREKRALRGLIDDVSGGRSRALVMVGDPGVGKSALLECAAALAAGFLVVRTSGVEAEVELPFAALQQLCVPMLDRVDHLPTPQRDALRVSFGLSTGAPPDRFLVGLAALGLLAEAGAEQPVLCVVDDAQWLDGASAQTLGFVARRLGAESVGIVFAVRRPNDALQGIEELPIRGLDEPAARDLLDSVLPAPLDERVRDQIVAETQGNPLALLELPRGATPGDLAGGFGLPGAVALSTWIEETFRRRFAELPADAQRLVLVAASEPLGDTALVWRAANRLGIGTDRNPEAAAGLLELGARARFRHPLVRSAVHGAASPRERRRVHRALAEATDPDRDPDRRAWHLAQATVGPDDRVADELDRSAGRAQARGGLAAAAAFLARSAALTLDPARRSERALRAAELKVQAGAPEAARELLAIADAGPLDGLQRARVGLLRAHIEFSVTRGSDAPTLLVDAARRLEGLDVAMARDTHLDAVVAAMFAGRLATGGGVVVAGKAALAAPALSPPRVADLLLDGLSAVAVEGYATGAPALKHAIRMFRDGEATEADEVRWLWVACIAAILLWDDESWDLLTMRQIELARRTGLLSALPIALGIRAGVDLLVGDLSTAASRFDEAETVAEVTGSQGLPYSRLAVVALEGRESVTEELAGRAGAEATARGEGNGLEVAYWTKAVLYNGLGRYDEAARVAGIGTQNPEDLAPTKNWTLCELVEAAARSGRRHEADEALHRLSATTRASGTHWARGTEARSRALLEEGQAAERLYLEAIEHLGQTRATAELARARLLYGEWLRRERRRGEARQELRAAHELFTTFGMEAFAERAANELKATGETARKRMLVTRQNLTPQEAQIARLARDGLSNPEIGARLFISPRTVEYHLHKVYSKLDIRSRSHLHRALAEDERVAERV